MYKYNRHEKYKNLDIPLSILSHFDHCMIKSYNTKKEMDSKYHLFMAHVKSFEDDVLRFAYFVFVNFFFFFLRTRLRELYKLTRS